MRPTSMRGGNTSLTTGRRADGFPGGLARGLADGKTDGIKGRGRRARRWLASAAFAGGAVVLTGAAAAAVVLATSGVFDRRAGAWTVPLRVLPGVAVETNVSGLLRLATSPVGVRVLDGRSTTTVLGTLRFARDGEALLVRCAPCRMHDARVAPRMVALPPTEMRLARRAGVESNNVLHATLTSAPAGIAAVDASATLTLSPVGVQVQWTLPAAPLAQVLRAFGDALPELRAAQVSGTVQGDGTFSLPALRPQTRLQFAEIAVAGLGTEHLAGGRISFVCRDAGGVARNVVTGEGERQWVAPEALGAWLPAAVLAAQDPRFHERFRERSDAHSVQHNIEHTDEHTDEHSDEHRDEHSDEHSGFDASALVRVLSGQAPGPGTLTQQLARTLYTGSDDTLVALLRELLYATEMERTLGKERILALHLNTVDWGAGACGARAAARLYFGKRFASEATRGARQGSAAARASQLTPLEAAWLAGILRDPERAYQQQVLGGVVDHQRTQWVLMQLRALPRAEQDRWRRQPLVFSTRARPALAVAGTGRAAP